MEYMLAQRLLELSEEEILEFLRKVKEEGPELYDLLVSILQEL